MNPQPPFPAIWKDGLPKFLVNNGQLYPLFSHRTHPTHGCTNLQGRHGPHGTGPIHGCKCHWQQDHGSFNHDRVCFNRVDMFIDIALAYALLNFIAVIAASRYFHKRKGLSEEMK